MGNFFEKHPVLSVFGMFAILMLVVQLLSSRYDPPAPVPTPTTIIQQVPQLQQPKPLVIDPNGRSPGAIEPNGNGNPIEPNGPRH
jgi:hypothetical protein